MQHRAPRRRTGSRPGRRRLSPAPRRARPRPPPTRPAARRWSPATTTRTGSTASSSATTTARPGATPVSVEVLDLGKEAGGLTPARRVGGQQTKGLALTGADGRSYTFRGLEKDASHLLDVVDPALKDSVFAKLLNDQMAAQHPASELIARGILEAVGIPVPEWRLVVLPDDPALGAVPQGLRRAPSASSPSTRSRRRAPSPASRARPRSSTTSTLYKQLEAGEGDAADTQALLKARLVDIFMGDWDRHRKQWRWAKVPGNPLWVPIPEDRDQAFSRYEGMRARLGRGAAIPASRSSARSIRTSAGSPTTAPSRTAASSSASREKTSSAPRRSSRASSPTPPSRRPSGACRRSGTRSTARGWSTELKARRDALPEVAAKYHEHLARGVDVYLTNQSERIEAKRLGDGKMDVTVRMRRARTARPRRPPSTACSTATRRRRSASTGSAATTRSPSPAAATGPRCG